jgi:4-hydroxybenzoate polyprenyltransferase
MPLFIILGVVTLLLLVGGFAGHQLLGVVGAVLLFFLSFMVLSGNLAIKDGEVQTTDAETNTTTVEYQYEAWDYGNYRLVGFLMAILAVTMFTLFLAGGELG